MGPLITEDGCKAKQPELEEHYLNDDTDGHLSIGDNRPEQLMTMNMMLLTLLEEQ